MEMVCTFYVGNRACLRCVASWYCQGDGVRHPCGRCDPPQANSTCGRSPTEHSFGYRTACEACPVGWVSLLLHVSMGWLCPFMHPIAITALAYRQIFTVALRFEKVALPIFLQCWKILIVSTFPLSCDGVKTWVRFSDPKPFSTTHTVLYSTVSHWVDHMGTLVGRSWP